MYLTVSFLPLLFLLSIVHGSEGYRRVCYYTNWSQYRYGIGKFFPENVEPTLCTHIVYAFATLDGNKLKAFEWNDESTAWSKGMFERLNAIKKINPSIKTLLAVGGWNMGTKVFSDMVSSPQNRQEFASSSTSYLRRHGFDGLDVDWEYPANRGSSPIDKHLFTDLLQDLRVAFEQDSKSTGKPRLLLTAAVAAGKDVVETAYNVPVISQLMDFVNLMTYDLHGSWEDYTGHNSPLYKRSGETGKDQYLNLDWAAQNWVSKGAPKEKINIGFAFYGRTFTLSNPSNHEPGAPTTGAGNAGKYTRQAGFLAYYEICKMQKQVYEIPEQRVRYAVSGNQWVGYDDEKSITEKTCYVKSNGFGGVMIWSLDLDDFGGVCGGQRYPLINAIINTLSSSTTKCSSMSGHIQTQPTSRFPSFSLTTRKPVYTQQPLKTTRQPYFTQTMYKTTRQPYYSRTSYETTRKSFQTTSATETKTRLTSTYPTNTIKEIDTISCVGKRDDFYPHPTLCTRYYICANSVTFEVRCGPGLYYNRVNKYCDRKENVDCSESQDDPVIVPTYRQPSTRYPITFLKTTARKQPEYKPQQFCEGRVDGLYRDPIDCSKFYQCSFSRTYKMSCGASTVFNEAKGYCDHKFRVPTCNN